MHRKREEEFRSHADKVAEDAGKSTEPDRKHAAQAGRDVDSARNPVGNGQGDAQADDPNNEMNTSGGSAKGKRPVSESRKQKTGVS